MVQDTGRRAEAVRDLKSQIANLTPDQIGEVVFLDISPGRQRVTLYRMDTGEPIPVPAYMVEGVLSNARLPNGSYAFTGDSAKAPEYKLGDIKCFLHPDSPERPILNEIGLGWATCPAAHLPNDYEKRLHGQHRHRRQWEAYQHHVDEQERKKYEERQEQQLAATWAMAKAAGGQPASSLEEARCDDCGWAGKPTKDAVAALRMHQRLHCSARNVPGQEGDAQDEPSQDG